MASLAVLRKAGSSSAIFRKLRIDPLRSAYVAQPSLTRSFSVDSQSQVASVDSRKGDAVDIDRRSQRSVSGRQDRPSALFADAFDPFSPTRSLSQVLNLMDQLMEDPFQAVSRGFSGGSRRGWDVKEDDNALSLRIDMPGLAKEDVKVAVEQNTLIIRGEGGREEGEEENERRYSSRIDLPPNLYKIDEIKAEMKNGVLKVVVPKVQEEERRDVYQVPVQ